MSPRFQASRCASSTARIASLDWAVVDSLREPCERANDGNKIVSAMIARQYDRMRNISSLTQIAGRKAARPTKLVECGARISCDRYAMPAKPNSATDFTGVHRSLNQRLSA